MLVQIYNSTGKRVDMSQVHDKLPPPPISVDIPRGKAGRWSGIWKNLKVVLEDSKAEDCSGESEQGSYDESGQPTEEKLPSDDAREEELIPNPELWGLGFEAMPRLPLPSKKNLKRAGSRKTKLWHMTRAESR